MRSKIFYTAGSIVALLVVLTIFFSIRPEGLLRRGEAAVTQAEVEAAGVAVTFTGKKAGADIPRVTGRRTLWRSTHSSSSRWSR